MRQWPTRDDPALARHAVAPRRLEGAIALLPMALRILVVMMVPLAIGTLLIATPFFAGQWILRISGMAIDTPPWLPAGLLIAAGGALLYFGVVTALAHLWHTRRARFALTDEAFLLISSKRIVVWPFAMIAGVSIDSSVFGWTVRIRSRLRPAFNVGLADAQALAEAFRAAGLAVRAPDSLAYAATADHLPPHETLHWRGRPGLRGFTRLDHIFIACSGLCLAAWTAFYIWVLDRIMAMPLDGAAGTVAKLPFMVMLTICFGAGPIYAFMRGIRHGRDLLNRAFGEIAITRERIVWLDVIDQRIREEIPAARIAEAGLVETDGKRGWITLAVRDEHEEIFEKDLAGLPRPDEAMLAIDRLMGR